MRKQIAILAGPMDWSDTRESWLARVPARVEELTAAKLSFRMVRGLFYGEIDEKKHWAALEIHRAVAIIEAQRELQKITLLHEALVERMRVVDEDFHRPQISQILDLVRSLRGKDRPGDETK